MAIDAVWPGDQMDPGGGGNFGTVFMGWDNFNVPLLGNSTCPNLPVATTAPTSNRLANVRFVREAIDEFGGTPNPQEIERIVEDWMDRNGEAFLGQLSLDSMVEVSGEAAGFLMRNSLGAWSLGTPPEPPLPTLDDILNVSGPDAGVLMRVDGMWQLGTVTTDGGVHVGYDPPPEPVPNGKLWLNLHDARTYIAYPQNVGHAWVVVGASVGGGDVLNIVTVSASGTDQASATSVRAGIIEVNSGTGGVRWGSPGQGMQCLVHNGTVNAIWFYPPMGGVINADQDRLSIQPDHTGYFVALANDRLVSVP